MKSKFFDFEITPKILNRFFARIDKLVGEKSPTAILTNAQVTEIRRLWKEGGKKYGLQAKLARQFKVSPMALNSIVHNRSYIGI